MTNDASTSTAGQAIRLARIRRIPRAANGAVPGRCGRRAARFSGVFAALLGLVAMAGANGSAQAHGAVVKPVSRQVKCKEDGGVWGPIQNMPNAACRALRQQSGAGWYTQWHEISQDIPDYTNEQTVKTAIPDGTLCSAGRKEYSGLNLARPDWYRTEIHPTNGTMEVIYDTPAAHHPNFFKFYLSKKDYDGTEPLGWGDLEAKELEIVGRSEDVVETSIGTTPIGRDRKGYIFTVRLPPGRTGNAVLFTRWQRKDGGGEGFYNCSDITIVGSGSPDPFPWHEKGVFIPQGFEVKAGQSLRFRVLSSARKGSEAVDLHLPVSNPSPHVWGVELANIINRLHTSTPPVDVVRVGVRNGNQIVPANAGNILQSMVYLKNEGDFHSLWPEDPPPGGEVSVSLSVDNSGTAPATIDLSAQASTASGANITRVEFYNGNTLLSADTSAPYQYSWRNIAAGTYSVKAKAIDSRNQSKETEPQAVTVQPAAGPGPGPGPGNPDDYPLWNGAHVGSYQSGVTIVRGLDGNLWKCRPHPHGGWCRINHPAYTPGHKDAETSDASRAWDLIPPQR